MAKLYISIPSHSRARRCRMRETLPLPVFLVPLLKCETAQGFLKASLPRCLIISRSCRYLFKYIIIGDTGVLCPCCH